jgi:hypothetical protein
MISVLAACSPSPAPTQSAVSVTPTQPSQTPQATPTPRPSSTPEPSPTPEDELVIWGEDVIIYQDPMGIYGNPAWFSQETIGVLHEEDTVKVLGQMGDSLWLFVEGTDGRQGWIRNPFLGYPDSKWDVPHLPFRLASGTFWFQGADTRRYDNLEIINDLDQDAFIVMIYSIPPDADHQYLLAAYEGTRLSVYVRSGETFRANDVYPPGPYQLFMFLGEGWYPDEGAFAENASAWQLADYQWFSQCPLVTSPGTSVTCDETIHLSLAELLDHPDIAEPLAPEAYPEVGIPVQK